MKDLNWIVQVSLNNVMQHGFGVTPPHHFFSHHDLQDSSLVETEYKCVFHYTLKKCFPVSQYKKLSAKQYPSSSSITQTLSTTIPETLLSNVIPQASSTTILETFLSIIFPQTLSTTIPEKLSFQHYPSNTTDYYNTGNTIFQALSTTIPET